MTAEKTNIIVILDDDMGWMDLFCQGHLAFVAVASSRVAHHGIFCFFNREILITRTSYAEEAVAK